MNRLTGGVVDPGAAGAAHDGRGPDPGGPGEVLHLITTRRARTRSALAAELGVARSTVTQRLDPLLAAGLVVESDEWVRSGGRPSRALELNPLAGVVVAVDVGEERTRVALVDLELRILAERLERLDLGDGPEVMLDRITRSAQGLISSAGLEETVVAGVGIGLPAPVDWEAGMVRSWSVLAGWDGFDVRGHLARSWPGAVLVDNDVNLLTLAEHRVHWPERRHLLYVKAGTGIGSGVVVDGRVHRGAQGAAGDVGHAHIHGYGDPACRCGNVGCLESLAGGWALARDLRQEGRDATYDARDVVALIRRGDSGAVGRVRAAGRVLGEAVAMATSLINPEVIVLGGLLGHTGDHLIAGVREVVYQRTLPLATRDLEIVPTRFRSRAGLAGAALLVRDEVLDPAAVDRALSLGSSPFARG